MHKDPDCRAGMSHQHQPGFSGLFPVSTQHSGRKRMVLSYGHILEKGLEGETVRFLALDFLLLH